MAMNFSDWREIKKRKSKRGKKKRKKPFPRSRIPSGGIEIYARAEGGEETVDLASVYAAKADATSSCDHRYQHLVWPVCEMWALSS